MRCVMHVVSQASSVTVHSYMRQPLTIKAILDTSKTTDAKTNLPMNDCYLSKATQFVKFHSDTNE